MAEQQRKAMCPRLIDYLAIVGSRQTNIKSSGNGQNPPVQVYFEYFMINPFGDEAISSHSKFHSFYGIINKRLNSHGV